MSALKFFIFIVANILLKTHAETSEFDLELIKIHEIAVKYVQLHLQNLLIKANDLSKTINGRESLFQWEYQRNLHFAKILFFIDEKTQKRKMYDNWLQRLQIFQEAQINHYQTITKDDFSNLEPKALNLEIDFLLRYHRPFTDEEIVEMKTMAEKNPSDVKEYHIVKREKIEKLLKLRYDLMQESFKKKSRTELNYQWLLFLGERVINQIDIWKRYGVTLLTPNDVFSQHVHPDLRILDNDNLYRRYMNYHDNFFPGNIFEGHVNRHDDPILHDYHFEANAELVIGSRFKPIRSLFREIHHFGIETNDFTRCKLEDLPLVDLLLDRLKSWTFWFPKISLNENQWFSTIVSENGKKLYMIKDKSKEYKTSDENAILRYVDKVMIDAKKFSLTDKTISTMYKSTLRIKNIIMMDTKLIVRNFFKIEALLNPFYNNRMINYYNSLNDAQLLKSLPPPQESSFFMHKQQQQQQQHDKLVLKKKDNSDNEKYDNKVDQHKSLDNGVLSKLETNFESTFNFKNNNPLSLSNKNSINVKDDTRNIISVAHDSTNHQQFGNGGDESFAIYNGKHYLNFDHNSGSKISARKVHHYK